MHLAVFGDTAEAALLAVAARAAGAAVDGPVAVAPHDRAVLDDVLRRVDAVVIEAPLADRFALAETAARHGVHALLAWPPASIEETRALVRLGEEAGVEIGVRRPLRWHPAVQAIRSDAPPGLLLWQQEIAGDPRTWSRRLADAVDVCRALAGGGGVRRVEAESVRLAAARPEATAVSLRFDNGAYTQISLRRAAADRCLIYAAGPSTTRTADLSGVQARLDAAGDAGAREVDAGTAPSSDDPAAPAALVAADLRAFLRAIADDRPAPVAALEALHTLRLVERLMERLR